MGGFLLPLGNKEGGKNIEKEIKAITKIFGNGIIGKDTEEEPRYPGVVDITWFYNFKTNNYEPIEKPEEDTKS